ncbi:unnamed protein product [Brassicogethes aeneus]|uniref:C2H2-type domain-containing protein n=1 Tax=Brassicogethes aeneus TaxID=1431903 RepID=A0A9P0AVV5_BRAAE|nr:unnamed protein product [Brassicogethes aeneus]
MNNFADQETPLTSGIAIKQDIKEEFDEDNSIACDDLGVKNDEEDYFDGAEQFEMKFEVENERLLDISFKNEETNKEILSEKVPKEEKGNEKNPLSKDRLFECDICPKKYKSRDGLNEHTKFVHKKHELDQFKCSICNYVTVRKSNFIKHLKIHDSKNYLKCKFCHYTTAWLYNLNTHVTRKHNLQNTGENKVEITGTMEPIVVKKEPLDGFEGSILTNKPRPTFADLEMPSTSGIAIKQEIKEEYDDLAVKIESTFTDQEDYYDEAELVEMKFEAEHESFVDIRSKSENVNKEIQLEKVVPKAEKEIEKNPKGKFECKVCPKTYQTRMGLFYHKKYVHKKHELEEFKCSKCDFVTVRKGILNKHVKIHDKSNYLKCQFCQYMAAELKGLNAHILSKHKLENKGENEIKITGKVYECTKCSYSTLHKAHYDNHLRVCLKLKNVKCYECHLCLYKTIHKSHLTTHIKSHNEIKKLKCLFCLYESNAKQNLDQHILTRHSDMLNESNRNIITSQIHHCQLCKYKSINKGNLKAHLKTHSVEMSKTITN